MNNRNYPWPAERGSVMDELNGEREISLGLCHSNGKLSGGDIQCLSFCKCDRRANSEGRKFSRVDSAGSWNRNPMRVNRIGLVTSLSLHHQHHHPRHHYYCRHVNRVYRIGIETSFLLQKEQSFQWNPRTHNDNMIFRCFIFQTFYSRPVRFFFLAGTGIVAKNAFFVMFWELQSLPVLGRRSYLQLGGKIKLDFQPLVEAEQPAGW